LQTGRKTKTRGANLQVNYEYKLFDLPFAFLYDLVAKKLLRDIKLKTKNWSSEITNCIYG